MLPLQEHWLCRPVGFSSAVLPLLDRKSAVLVPFTFQHNTDLTVVQALFWKFTLGVMVPRRSPRVIIVGYIISLRSGIVISVLAFLENLEIESDLDYWDFFFPSTRQFHYVVVLAVLELCRPGWSWPQRSPASAEIDERCVPPLLTEPET